MPKRPRNGSMRSGVIVKKAPCLLLCNRKGYSWPTPVASDFIRYGLNLQSVFSIYLQGRQRTIIADLILARVPKNRFMAIQEYLMGLPKGWSDLDDLNAKPLHHVYELPSTKRAKRAIRERI